MLGKRLKEIRKINNLTQIDFATIFNISNGTIAMWETNKREPDFEMIKKIANYFNVSIDYLLGRTQKEKPPAEAGSFEEFNQALESLGIADDLDEQKKLLKKITSLSPKQKQLIFQMIDNFKKDDN